MNSTKFMTIIGWGRLDGCPNTGLRRRLDGRAPDLSKEPQTAESEEQRDARMSWWREAKFGMFIHWVLYTVPASKYHEKVPLLLDFFSAALCLGNANAAVKLPDCIGNNMVLQRDRRLG